MPTRKELTPEEEHRCLEFLKVLGVDQPHHRVLSDRGFFGIFLCGLHPEDIGEEHPDIKEFRETVRLLSIAGVERLRILLEQQNRKAKPPGPPSSQTNPTPSPNLPASDSKSRPKPQFSRDIHVVRPSEEARERLNSLEKADTLQDALQLSRKYASESHFHDAYHILFEFLLNHPIDQDILEAAANIVLLASESDREKGKPPFNMLYECEEIAAVLAKRIPDICHLSESGDIRTARLYRHVKTVYHLWTTHCMALLDYKYRINNHEYMRRNWIEPRDFGFLVDVMKLGVRSRLPLDLLRYILEDLRKCIAIGQQVVAHDAKKAKFEGDVLRFIASPTKDVIPDLCYEIFVLIVDAYRRQGDTAAAMTFCKQALLINKHDREMQKIWDELRSHAKVGAPKQMPTH